MPVTLMWWEFEQLLDHLRQRQDIWSSPREYMWMRQVSDEDDTAILGLAVSPPQRSGPYRQFTLRAVPLSWTAEQCEDYLLHLCRYWTDYGTRLRYTEFLVTELKLEPAKAHAAAIGLCGIEQLGEPDPERSSLPTNRELWPDIEGPDLNVQYSERVLRTFGITGGGWLSVRLQGGMLRVRCSLRSDGKFGGGYSGAFEGFIRPANGNINLAAAFLYGTTVSTHGEVTFGDGLPATLYPDRSNALCGDKYVWNGLLKDLPPGQKVVADAADILEYPPTSTAGSADVPRPDPAEGGPDDDLPKPE